MGKNWLGKQVPNIKSISLISYRDESGGVVCYCTPCSLPQQIFMMAKGTVVLEIDFIEAL